MSRLEVGTLAFALCAPACAHFRPCTCVLPHPCPRLSPKVLKPLDKRPRSYEHYERILHCFPRCAAHC
jgi:hypothetical protein